MSFSYSDQEIVDRIKFENPWWTEGRVDEKYYKMNPRQYFTLFYDLVKTKVNRAIVLMGPRRVGKTVMLYQLVQKLLSKRTSRSRIAFMSLETPIYSNLPLEKIFAYARMASGRKDLKGWYIIFDEIQYVKDWERHLTSLVNSYPDCKFVVSGSAAAALKLKSQESGAGRFTNFMLPPLTFYEFLKLQKKDNKSLKKTNEEFVNYINYGGFPEAVFSKEIRKDPQRFIRDDIVDKVLLRDLPSLYDIRDVVDLKNLFNVIVYNAGHEFSLETLAKDSGIDKITIGKYLQYLEAAFLIKRVYKISNTAKRFKRVTNFKIYITNISLRTALFSPMKESDKRFGHLVENAIFCQNFSLSHLDLYYAQWPNGEVDMVVLDEKFKPEMALEIKWSDRYVENPKQLSKLLYFAKKNGLKKVFATSKAKWGDTEIDGIKIDFAPCSIMAKRMGESSINQQKKLQDFMTSYLEGDNND